MIANLYQPECRHALSRHKEVAVKKMMGGSKTHIVLQFCIENFILVASSILLAFCSFNLSAAIYQYPDRRTGFGDIVLDWRVTTPWPWHFCWGPG